MTDNLTKELVEHTAMASGRTVKYFNGKLKGTLPSPEEIAKLLEGVG